MAGTLNALGLLVVIAAIVYVMRRYGRRPKQFRQFIYSLLTAGVALIIVSTLTAHMCNAGQPISQLLIPAIGLVLTLTFVEDGFVSMIMVPLLCVAMLGLGFHYDAIVHSTGYTGNPAGVNRSIKVMQNHTRTQIRQALEVSIQKSPALATNTYLAGYFDQSDVMQLVDAETRDGSRRTLAIDEHQYYWLWHSPITGIFGVSSHPTRLWYPGGPLKSGMAGLEYRPAE